MIASSLDLQILEFVLSRWQQSDTLRALHADMLPEDAELMTAWLRKHPSITLRPFTKVGLDPHSCGYQLVSVGFQARPMAPLAAVLSSDQSAAADTRDHTAWTLLKVPCGLPKSSTFLLFTGRQTGGAAGPGH